MSNLLIGIIGSSAFTIGMTIFGRWLDSNRKDKNDRIKEYRIDNSELKRELKKVQEKLAIVEEERTNLRIEVSDLRHPK